MTNLPYIHVNVSGNLPLKFLIDTGSSTSFINPELVFKHQIEKINPVNISTVFNNHVLDKKVTYDYFPNLANYEPLTFKFIYLNFIITLMD